MSATMNGTARKPLGDVARFIRGITFKPDDKVAPRSDGSVVCMRTKNVQEDLDESDLIAVPREFVKRDEQYLHESDILVSTANSWELVGKCSWVPELDYDATAGGFISILRADVERVYPRYLYYWFSSAATQHYVRHCGRQTTNISNMSYERCLGLEIPLPPLPEQKRIADILDKADAIRRKRQSAIERFESLGASVFNEMFSDRLRSAEWSALSEYLTELRYGTSNKSGNDGYTTLRIPNIVRGIIDLGELKTVEVSDKDFKKLRLTDGDMLFVRTNGNPDYVGRCAVFDSQRFDDAGLQSEEIIYASYLIRARLQLDRLRPVFLQSYLQTVRGRRNVREKCRTSAGQYNINTKGIGSLHIPDIPIDEQREFESRIAALAKPRTNLSESRTATDDLFSSLVQRAFKGEL